MALTVATGASALNVANFLSNHPNGADNSETQSQRRTSFQRIGWLVNSVGVAHLCYYDPVGDKIYYQDQSGQVAPSLHQ